MTSQEENITSQDVIKNLQRIFLCFETEGLYPKGWRMKKSNSDLTKVCGLKIFVEPTTAISVDEVQKFTVSEVIQGMIQTTFERES